MSVQDAPILGLLRDTLSFLTQRQKLLATNVANANTPGYVPQDINESAFERALNERMASGASAGLPSAMTVTSDRHLASRGAHNGLVMKAESVPDSEVTVDGNAVVLEEQMTRVVDTQMRYEMVVGLYEKSLGLIRLAAKPPGR